MFTKRYIKIGTYAGNDIQLSNPEVHPFHAILMQDVTGKVYLSLCVAGAKVMRNGSTLSHTEELFANDSIQIGSSELAIKDLFTWPQGPTLVPQQNSTEPNTETADTKQKMSLQLILIYTAVALLLILIAFYV